MLIVLSVFEKVANQITDKDAISFDTYELLINSVNTIKEMAVHTITISKVDKIIAMFKKYEDEKEKIFQSEKKKRIDNYWEKHKDEKDALIAEQKTIVDEIKSLEPQINDYDKKADALVQKKSRKIDVERVCDEQLTAIEELEKQKNQLGIFKGKEKKALQEQIDQEKEKLSMMREQAEKEKKVYRNEINQQINDLNAQKSEVVKRRDALKKRCSAIEIELTKDRE